MDTTPSTNDIIYTAGLFDGEGSISLLSEYGRSLTLMVALGNTDRPIIDWLRATFGGNDHTEKADGLSRKPFWRWYIRGDAAFSFLELIRPHLKIKRENAWLACEGWANRYATKGREPLNPETQALRLGYYLAMRYANGRVPQDEARLLLHESKWRRVTVACCICGTSITKRQSRLKPSGNAVCSTECLRLFQRRHLNS